MLDKIQYLCKLKGVSQNKLEKELGFSNGAMSKWDISSPSIDKIEKVADYFDVSIDYLIDREIDDTETELTDYLEELKNRSEMRMLFKVSKNATKEDIEKTVKMLEAWGYKDDGDCEGC